MNSFSPEIVTERLILRPWQVADAPRLKQAIDENLEHLRPWMPWAMNEPSPLEEIEERIATFLRNFETGGEFVYGIVARDDGRILGSSGLHRRIDEGLEIGYWIDHRELGRGYATEAASALMKEAFRDPQVRRVQIRCDPRNVASAAVPGRLGFVHVETIANETTTPDGSLRDTMVWEYLRPEDTT